MKRIHHRWVSSEIAIPFGADPAKFSLRTLEGWNGVSLVVFMNSHITKMHNSLPLRFFSLTTFSTILRRGQGPQFVMASWCLLTAGLILRGQSTRTRGALLNMGFWFLFIYRNHLKLFGYPPGVTQRKTDGKIANMYTTQQLRDALNTFIALIVILQHSINSVCLNRLGSGPLEHGFGRAPIRCRDVITMKKIINAFTTDVTDLPIDKFLKLTVEPRRPAAVGVDCEP
jgi:hypothetical protein